MNEILNAAYARATTKNYLYNRHRDRWLFLLNSYVGGDEYRKGAYLTRYQLESDSDYNQRLINTPLDNQCKSIISLYISFLFRTEPDREFGQLESSPWVDAIEEDADLDGRSLNAFMKDVAIWSQVFGHAWVCVAKPDIGATTAADEVLLGVRPYLSVLTPLAVTDWSWTRQPNGSYALSMIRYIEEMNDTETTIKEWNREVIRTTIINVEREEATNYFEEVNGLGEIPFVLVYSERSPTRGIGLSIISDVADQQRAEYNEMSEVEQSIRLDSHPSLVATGETEVGTGAGALIRLPENLDPQLKPYVLEFSGASVESIYNSISQRRQMIDSMTNVGSVRATETREMSGIAIETDFQLLNARLSSLADNLELAEEQIWQWVCAYSGTPWNGEINYPDNFAIRNIDGELNRLVSARGAVVDPVKSALIDDEIISLLGIETAPLVIGGECPLVMSDKQLNIANHLATVKIANLGPASVSNPGTYWMERATRLNLRSEEESRSQTCSNCGYYTNDENIQACYKKNDAVGNIPLASEVNPAWENVPNPAGYCEKYDITCTPTRTCDSWEVPHD